MILNLYDIEKNFSIYDPIDIIKTKNKHNSKKS